MKQFKKIISLILGIVLLFNGIWLSLFKDKVHLGTIIPILLGLIFIIYAFWQRQILQYIHKTPKRNFLWNSIWILFWLWSLSVVLFFLFFLFIQNNIQTQSQKNPVQAIIILGSGIENTQPSPTLKQRLDLAAQYALTQPHAVIIVSGGKGYSEQYTEAEVMKNYLIQHYAIDPTQILLENKSTSTALNLQNSKQVLAQQNINIRSPIAISTSDFHTIRAAAIAHKQGYQHIIMLAAPTPLYTRYNAWLREYFAFLSGWLLQEY